jgi:ribosomal protein L22
VRAKNTYVSISPQKLRLVIDQVRGLGAKQAATVL